MRVEIVRVRDAGNTNIDEVEVWVDGVQAQHIDGEWRTGDGGVVVMVWEVDTAHKELDRPEALEAWVRSEVDNPALATVTAPVAKSIRDWVNEIADEHRGLDEFFRSAGRG